MKIHNSGAIVTGLAVFVILALFPIWYNAMSGGSDYASTADLNVVGAKCVKTDTEWMRKNHMALLNEWRDLVVRENQRFYNNEDGQQVERSLTNTCMACHLNTPENPMAGKAVYCGVCHVYVGVEIYCWECHSDPVDTTKPVSLTKEAK